MIYIFFVYVFVLCTSNINYRFVLYNCYFLAIELIKLLMEYEIQDSILRGLVRLLRPAKEDIIRRRPDIMDGRSRVWIQNRFCKVEQDCGKRGVMYECKFNNLCILESWVARRWLIIAWLQMFLKFVFPSFLLFLNENVVMISDL